MTDRWYRQAVVYCVDVETFQDSDGDGVGDLRGLLSRLDYLARLGVTCLWLNPVHPTPNRDDGYDVADYYAVDPRLGTLGDMAELLHEAANRGIRVIIDLVVNHTSDEHPWFASARADRDSPYRDWYVWSDSEPSDRKQGMVFPGVQDETWTLEKQTEAWYYHRFYGFEPDLQIAHEEVREEIKRIVGFWLQLGVAGFRMDAAPFVIELTKPGDPNPKLDFGFLGALHDHIEWRGEQPVILAEANVPDAEVHEFFGDGGGTANRLPLIFAFGLNQALMLGLARGDAGPVAEALAAMPAPPAHGQWATFLRNHDEVDLGRLTDDEREEVFRAFGPDESMRLYGRGIRRRLAPMLGGDRRRLEMAYSLQATLPGTPVFRYGEEIGMGEDLSLPERNAIRTPMQWGPGENGGFSAAPADRLVRPVVSDPAYAPDTVNVAHQRRDPASLLSWFERMLRTLRECPETGTGAVTVLDADDPAVLATRLEGPTGCMVFLHNLSDREVTVDLGGQPGEGRPVELFANGPYDEPEGDLRGLRLDGYGYRWIRLRQGPVHPPQPRPAG